MTSALEWPPWALLRERQAEVQGLRIAVLFGGHSSEREVSLISGHEVLQSLRGQSELVPECVQSVEWLPDGNWRVDEVAMTPARALEALHPKTVFLIALHGGEGEGGSMQGFLQTSGRTFTGAGVAASALCLDKVRSRQIFAHAGLRLAPGMHFHPGQWPSSKDAILRALQKLGEGPWFIKPSLGGSSVSMSMAASPEEFCEALDRMPMLEPGELLLVEQAIAGTEVTQGLLESSGLQLPTLLPLVEIRPGKEAWFDYKEKYSADGAAEFCPPQSVSPSRQKEVGQAALAAWESIGLNSYARIDFIVPDEGPPVLLEANTLPGFTARSLFPMAAGQVGLPFRELCLELCLRAQTNTQKAPTRGGPCSR